MAGVTPTEWESTSTYANVSYVSTETMTYHGNAWRLSYVSTETMTYHGNAWRPGSKLRLVPVEPQRPRTPPPPIREAPRHALSLVWTGVSTVEQRRRPRMEARPSRALRERRRVLTR